MMIKILLAEDEKAMREHLTRALQKANYDVVAVDRGTAAVPHLETGEFDLLLTELQSAQQRLAAVDAQTIR